ncbi:hypothetical protein GCM10011349_33190 [Novosphingobium indicum]|uniref:Lipoprotein n=1 Tax=Novosphingobium indicum TaxID=462949 RepID=A0ABQ2JSK2_9SPHN|nr:DUF6488 family protein [Novosphingobium indicum]GGN55975.1 hypothetical protein GCM10011349_33190 [Novosphingobium indicum]
MHKFLFAGVAAVSAMALGAPACAHPEGHENHARSERKPVRVSAKEAVVKLVTQSKLPASWAKVEAGDAALKPVGGESRWVVTFENAAIREASQRKLYVVLTASGEFVSAGYKAV